MASFVLVHGAWAGGFVWKSVRPLLWSAGHAVFTPTLTGVGERVHLGTPETNLSTHIEDVVNVIEYEDLRDLVLVGYSYGGMVVTGVTDRVPDRIAHLVYLDAFLPNDGQSIYDLGGSSGAPVEGEDWRTRRQRPPATGVAQAARMARITTHPRGCFEEKVRLSVPLEERPFTRTYIKAGLGMMMAGGQGPGERRGHFWEAAERTRNDPAWRYYEIAATHGAPFEAPLVIAGILRQLVEMATPLFTPA